MNEAIEARYNRPRAAKGHRTEIFGPAIVRVCEQESMQELRDQSHSPTAGRSLPARSSPAANRAATAFPQRQLNHQDLAVRLHRIRRLSRVMDTAVRIPGTKLRFGLDSIIGLVPGIGDAATAGISAWIVREAYASGVPSRVLMRMLGNIAIDFAGGSIPLAGDVFDVYWKANHRNVELLEDLLRNSQR